MSNDRYANIRKALAMGPTAGPWSEYVNHRRRLYIAGADGSLITFIGSDDDVEDANAAHIAACDPDTIRALLAERDQLATALDALRAEVGETKEVAVRAMRQRDAQYNRAGRLAEALALLPDDSGMVEHNPEEGPSMFCCGGDVTFDWLHGPIRTHDEDCWYARMRALRDHDQDR